MNNGYNEVRWTSVREEDTRKYIVEYSKDGRSYQSAGEVMAGNKMTYELKHPVNEVVPLLYRLKIEDLHGRHFYTRNSLLEGVNLPTVKIFPTIISGSTVSATSYFPVERVMVFNGSGQQVYSQDIGGRSDLLNIPLPALSKGMYFMVFYGRDWKTTEKFIVS
jgi:hypothetical protein